jgi:hypothetical protein
MTRCGELEIALRTPSDNGAELAHPRTSLAQSPAWQAARRQPRSGHRRGTDARMTSTLKEKKE